MKYLINFRDGFSIEVDVFGNVQGWENLGYINSLPQADTNALSLRTKGKKEYRSNRSRNVDLFICPQEKLTYIVDSSG